VADLIVAGVHHVIVVVAFECRVEQSAAQSRNRQRAACVEGVHLPTELEFSFDDAERAAGAECTQVEVVYLSFAGPVKRLGQVEQLTLEVRAEGRVQLSRER
jgi:hypothetical protein